MMTRSPTPPCPICLHAPSRLRYTLRGWAILECPTCLGWHLGAPSTPVPSSPPPSASPYEGSYFSRGEGDTESLSGYYDYEAELPLHLRNFSENLNIVRQHAHGVRLLDVGCATGHFLLAAQRAGFHVLGLDMSAPAIAKLRARWGIDALAGDITRIELDERFDVITLWETIEHLSDPEPVLRKVREWLKPDGVLLIGTGNNRSLVARLMGRRWWYLNPPDHTVYYNRRALGTLLARVGFQVDAWHRILAHRVSSRNVAMKLLRSFQVDPARALRVAGALPDIRLVVPHGTTMVVASRRGGM